MIRLCILDEKLDDLDLKITRYVNNNVKEVINVAIDFLEDDNGFDILYLLIRQVLMKEIGFAWYMTYLIWLNRK